MVVLVGAMAGAGSAGETDSSYQTDLHEGAQLLREGKHARALARFKLALNARPESAEAYYWIALAYSDLANHDHAAAHAEKATLLDAKLAKAWLLWGQSLMHLHKWEDAKRKLDQAHRLAPNNPLVAFSIGRCYFHGFGDARMALEFFDKTLKLGNHPDVQEIGKIHAQARLYAGECYLAKDMPLMAINRFKEAIQDDPQNAQMHFRLGLAYRQAGMFAEARTSLLECVRLEPAHFEAHLALGHLYLSALPDAVQARQHLNAFYTQAPKDHPWRARVYDYYARKAAEAQARQSGQQPN